MISYRADDDPTKYNIYGNNLYGNTGLAGFFRYIQLENDYVINFCELETYVTTNCFGNCSYCRVDEQFAVPTSYPNNLRGTCYDVYAG